MALEQSTVRDSDDVHKHKLAKHEKKSEVKPTPSFFF